MNKAVMLIDDSITIHRVIDLCVDKDKYQVLKAFSADEASIKIKSERPDIILLDNKLDGIKLNEFIDKVRNLCNCWVVLLVGAFDQFNEDDLAETGADDFLFKPFDAASLDVKISEGLEALSNDSDSFDNFSFTESPAVLDEIIEDVDDEIIDDLIEELEDIEEIDEIEELEELEDFSDADNILEDLEPLDDMESLSDMEAIDDEEFESLTDSSEDLLIEETTTDEELSNLPDTPDFLSFDEEIERDHGEIDLDTSLDDIINELSGDTNLENASGDIKDLFAPVEEDDNELIGGVDDFSSIEDDIEPELEELIDGENSEDYENKLNESLEDFTDEISDFEEDDKADDTDELDDIIKNIQADLTTHEKNDTNNDIEKIEEEIEDLEEELEEIEEEIDEILEDDNIFEDEPEDIIEETVIDEIEDELSIEDIYEENLSDFMDEDDENEPNGKDAPVLNLSELEMNSKIAAELKSAADFSYKRKPSDFQPQNTADKNKSNDIQGAIVKETLNLIINDDSLKSLIAKILSEKIEKIVHDTLPEIIENAVSKEIERLKKGE